MTTRTPITLSPELQQIIDALAEAERRDPEAVLKDALTQYERGKNLEDLHAYGREQARRTGLKPSDIDREIHAQRQQNRSR
jgi:predicted transcriptional regulator